VVVDIRTYGVVTLNEECGFIQWVSNTVPVRNVLVKLYEQRNIPGGWVGHHSVFISNGIEKFIRAQNWRMRSAG